MYIKGEQYERAADMYIRHLIKGDKSKITEAALIMEKVQNDQLNSSFAKACVSCGRYQEAVKAYERANDTDKVKRRRDFLMPFSSSPLSSLILLLTSYTRLEVTFTFSLLLTLFPSPLFSLDSALPLIISYLTSNPTGG